MRRLIILVAVLLALPVVFAYMPCDDQSDCYGGYNCIGNFCLKPCQSNADCANTQGTCQPSGYCSVPQDFCGDGIASGNEQCDPGDEQNSPDDSACPGFCNSNCLCEKEVNFVLFEGVWWHNMLFSKVMDLLHIIKEAVYQLEIKTIEIQLTNFDCDQQPFSFKVPATLSQYGKLNEVIQIVRYSIKTAEDGQSLIPPADFGNIDLFEAQNGIDNAIIALNSNDFEQSFMDACCAYAALIPNKNDLSCNGIIVI